MLVWLCIWLRIWDVLKLEVVLISSLNFLIPYPPSSPFSSLTLTCIFNPHERHEAQLLITSYYLLSVESSPKHNYHLQLAPQHHEGPKIYQKRFRIGKEWRTKKPSIQSSSMRPTIANLHHLWLCHPILLIYQFGGGCEVCLRWWWWWICRVLKWR